MLSKYTTTAKYSNFNEPRVSKKKKKKNLMYIIPQVMHIMSLSLIRLSFSITYHSEKQSRLVSTKYDYRYYQAMLMISLIQILNLFQPKDMGQSLHLIIKKQSQPMLSHI